MAQKMAHTKAREPPDMDQRKESPDVAAITQKRIEARLSREMARKMFFEKDMNQ